MDQEIIPVSVTIIDRLEQRINALENVSMLDVGQFHAITTEWSQWRSRVTEVLSGEEGEKQELILWVAQLIHAVQSLGENHDTLLQQLNERVTPIVLSTERTSEEAEQRRSIKEEVQELKELIQQQSVTSALSSLRMRLDKIEKRHRELDEKVVGNQEELTRNVRAEVDQYVKDNIFEAGNTYAELKEKISEVETKLQGIREEMTTDKAASFKKTECSAMVSRCRTDMHDKRVELKASLEALVREEVDKLKRELATSKGEIATLKQELSTRTQPFSHMGPFATTPPQNTTPSFVAPPIPAPPTTVSGAHVRFTKTLTKLTFHNVRNWVNLFKAYRNATNISEAEAKIVLLQSVEGEAARYVAPLAEHGTVNQLLAELTKRVKPSDARILKALQDIRMKPRESVMDFYVRFVAIANELIGFTQDRIRDYFLNALTLDWRRTARSLIMSDSSLTTHQLADRLATLEGTDAIDSADFMQVDTVRVSANDDWDVQFAEPINVIANQGSYGNGMRMPNARDTRGIINLWKQMCRSDPNAREECLRWMMNKPNPRAPMRQNNRGRYQNPSGFVPNRQNRSNRIFHVREDEEREAEEYMDDVFDDRSEGQIATVQVTPVRQTKIPEPRPFDIKRTTHKGPVQVLHKSDKRSATSIATTEAKEYPLMYVQSKINGVGCEALIDTGAGRSLMPLAKAQKMGLAIDTSNICSLESYDGTPGHTYGTATANVTVGDASFEHQFGIVNSSKMKIIFGNDMLTEHELDPKPARRHIVLANGKVVKCHVVLPKTTEGTSMDVQPTENCQTQLTLQAVEKTLVDPVWKDGALLIPTGQSMVLPAKGSKTIVMPWKTSKTVAVQDTGRLPPGVISASTTWSQHQRLRVTVVNTTERSVMLGSRSAVGAVLWKNPSEVVVARNMGTQRTVRCV